MAKPFPPPKLPRFDIKRGDDEPSNMQETLTYFQSVLSIPPNALTDVKGRYLHWDQLRLRPLPEAVLDHELWWHALKLRRKASFKTLPFESITGDEFMFLATESMQAQLHQIDQQMSGRIEAPEITTKQTRDRYIINSLIEEAITSSQLEGASTSHQVAKSMLRENREPTNKSERMIVNNYEAMRFIRDAAKNDALDEALLLELHRLVSKGTLDTPSAEGHFKTTDETAVFDNRTQEKLHQPPPVKDLTRHMDALYQFANQQNDAMTFIHPVVRGIILHFMLAYIHPFEDGNGRTARALFYWLMARYDYWMMEFVSISTIIKEAPAQYRTAYLYVETDDNDMTYFIDYHIRVITKAIQKLETYLKEKSVENASIHAALRSTEWRNKLNHRQIALLSSALKTPNEIYTVTSHAKSHNVAKQTARNDLNKLTLLGLLVKQAIGKTETFRPASNLNKRLKMR